MKLQLTQSMLLALFFSTLGLAYEFSYFHTLNLNVFNYFTFEVFLIKGLFIFLSIIVPLFIFSQIFRFFDSKSLEGADKELFNKIISQQANFKYFILFSRVIFSITLILWLIVFFQISFPYSNYLTGTHIYSTLLLYCLIYFIMAMLTAPKTAVLTVSTVFILCFSLNISSFGCSQAERSLRLSKNGIIRNDSFVLITKRNNSYEVKAKPMSFNIPVISKLIEKIL